MNDPVISLPGKIHQLAERLKASDGETAACALDLVQALMDFHGAGINRMMEIISEHCEHCTWPVFEKLGNDHLVSSMLLTHDLHPLSVESRVETALDNVRPLLRSHGGDVELIAVTDSRVQLRLVGSCHGCSSSSLTIKTAIEQAIFQTAPDITAIEVVGGIDETDSKTTPVQLVCGK